MASSASTSVSCILRSSSSIRLRYPPSSILCIRRCFTTSAFSSRALRTNHFSPSSSSSLPVSLRLLSRQPLRFFSTTSQLSQTTSSSSSPIPPTISPPPIIITERCAEEIRNNLRTGFSYLRYAVFGGGCDGYKYDISYETGDPDPEDTVIDLRGAKVAIDPDSLPILRGSILDYENTLESEGIHVSFNPNARHSCGCKTSFSLIPGFEFK